ncbi:MAG: hypothetical protein H7070_04940 [Saprospiraceae bacterium]|nr:hypothetical protein [Pyrinomonadaceae bacterium]
MKKYPIHENLNTSFVNLKALVAFLRDLQFVGSVHVELSSYEADITFTQANLMLAREHDHIAGRISHGEHALQRILIRAAEPCGRIHVYNAPSETRHGSRETAYVDEVIALGARETITNRSDTPAIFFENKRSRFTLQYFDQRIGTEAGEGTQMGLPDLPYALRDTIPEKTVEPLLSTEEWEVFLNLTEELLRTIDKSLAKVNLNFDRLFENACGLIAGEYPFLDPELKEVGYKNGNLKVQRQIPSGTLLAGLIATLRRIFDRLHEEMRFVSICQFATHRLRILMQKRKPLYEHYRFTPKLTHLIKD